MRIGIRNKASEGQSFCSGWHTEIFLIDNDGNERKLEGVKKIEFEDITCDGWITAKLDCYIALLDIGPVKASIHHSRYMAQHLHNKAEMERLGLSRIN